MPIPDPPPPARSPTGAGALIILALFTGIVIGFLLHQPTIGFLVGGATGVVIAILLWWRERT